MTNTLEQLDWNYIRAFLAVAETGSLTKAAAKTGLSQPTIGRHIKGAEAQLGEVLFDRRATGLSLTDFGANLLQAAEDMAVASGRLAAIAKGHDQAIAGTVRITASVVVSHFLMPTIIADLRRAEPKIEIELVPSDRPENLTFRAADIAIRMFRPTELDIVTKKIGEQTIALYAAHDLLDQFGQVQSLPDLMALPFVGFDQSDMIIRAMRETGINVDRSFFGVRCDDQATYWRLVCAGCGVGAMQAVIGDAEPKVAKLDYQPSLPKLPIWLAANANLRKSARIRRVWDFLAEALATR